MRRIRAFIVDDEVASRELLTYLLMDAGGIEIAGYYSDATILMNEIPKKNPDVIFTDIAMPCLNGIDSARIIHSKYPDLKIVFVTAFSENIAKTSEINHDGLLLKPFDLDEVSSCLNKLKHEFT